MPNFDALRSAIIGPLAYICRPKEKPAELLALYTLDGNTEDLSRYGGSLVTTQGPVYSDDGLFGKCAKFAGALSHPSTSRFSIDFFGIQAPDRYAISLSSSTWTGSGVNGISWDGNWGGRYWARLSGNTAIQFAGGPESPVLQHIAFTYDGTTIRYYINGALTNSQTAILNTQSDITFYNFWKFSNFRVVGKVLGNSSSFPVPSGLYTGYEVL